MEIFERFKSIIAASEFPFVIEFGACDGYHSNIMLGIIKKTEKPFVFHTFEPNQELLGSVLKNLQGHLMFNNGIIGVFPHAVGATIGEQVFYKSFGKKIEKGKITDHYYGSSSIRKPKKSIFKQWKGMEFEKLKTFVTTFDYHIERHGLIGKPIDFIWTDIQGAEIDLIKGGAETFKNVKYIYTEYSNKQYYEGQVGLDDILKLLPDFEVVEDYVDDILLKNKILVHS